MRTLSRDLLSAVDHLPAASVLSIDGIGWEEFERIGEDLAERSGLRIAYDRGRLEIVTTSAAHEKWKEFIQDMVRCLCDEMDWHLESFGGMTIQSSRLQRAVEADTCFYIANAGWMIGKEEVDIDVDPPPDVVVEVDKAGQSRRKFPIYAAFGVPEIWRVDVRRGQIGIFERRSDDYDEVPSSRFLPMLTGEVLMRFVEESRVAGQTPALASFRRWIRGANE